MAILTGKATYPGGKPVTRMNVTVRLVAAAEGEAAGYRSDKSQVIGVETCETDNQGVWSIDLTPNSLLAPAGTHYEVVEAFPRRNAVVTPVIIPDGPGPYQLSEVAAMLPDSPNEYVGQTLAQEKGQPNGVATLDGSGKVPDGQIPAGVARDSEVTAAVAAEATARDSAIAAAVAAEATARGNADNTEATARANADTAEAQARVSGDATVQASVDAHKARVDNPHAVTKAQVGLGNVDNTSDVNKPVSTAQATADNAARDAAKTYADTQDTAHVSASNPHTQYALRTSTDSSADLNSLSTPGFYRILYSADWATRNIPVADAGHLHVMRSFSQVLQKFSQGTNGSTGSYIRHSNDSGGTWGAWVPEGQGSTNAHVAASDPHTQYAKKAGDSFSGAVNIVKTGGVMQSWQRTENAANAKRWQQSVFSDGTYAVEALDDAGAVTSSPLRIGRSGSMELDTIKHSRGTGSPEGFVGAPVGSRYIDTAATNGAVEWIKATGTGTTGWRVAYGDTGRRNISSLLLNGWTGSVFIRRTTDFAYIEFEPLTPTTATAALVLNVPAGFKTNPQTRIVLNTIGSTPIFRRADWNGSGNTLTMGSYATGDGSYYCQAVIPMASAEVPWPTTLPGVPG